MSENTVKNAKIEEQDGGVFINKHKGNFTIITNKVINANFLSSGALGLYIIIAQKITIPGYILYKTNLRNSLNSSNGKALGKRAFQTLWDELKNKGYLKQYRIRTSEGFKYQYELLDEPNKERPSLIMVKLCEELVADKNGVMVIRNKAVAEEESLPTEEDLVQTEVQDLVGSKKNIEVKYMDLTSTDKEYIKNLYKNVGYNSVLNYEQDPDTLEISANLEWKRKQEAVRDQREDKLKKLMPILYNQVELNLIDERDRKMGEEIMETVADLIAPESPHMIHICGNHWPQEMVLKNIMQKLNKDTLERTIYQIKTYDKKVRNYRKFMQTTLYNNILTYETWFNRNFTASYYGTGDMDDDFAKGAVHSTTV